jgi:hypothetical protein
MGERQLGIYRLKSAFGFRTVVDRIHVEPELSWMRTDGDMGEIFAISREAVVTCCLWTSQGYAWTLDKVGGKPPMLNIDEIAALRSQVELGEFTDLEAFLKCVMHMFRTSFNADVQLVLERMGLAKEAAHLAQRRRETKDRHSSWISHVMEKYNLVIRLPEGIEKKRHEYTTRAAFDRWFRTIGPYLEGVHVDNIYNTDEIGIEVSHNLKVICTAEQRVFRQEEEESAHLTLMLCVNRRGEGPIPMVVVPNLASCHREFRAIHGSDAHITASPSG